MPEISGNMHIGKPSRPGDRRATSTSPAEPRQEAPSTEGLFSKFRKFMKPEALERQEDEMSGEIFTLGFPPVRSCLKDEITNECADLIMRLGQEFESKKALTLREHDARVLLATFAALMQDKEYLYALATLKDEFALMATVNLEAITSSKEPWLAINEARDWLALTELVDFDSSDPNNPLMPN